MLPRCNGLCLFKNCRNESIKGHLHASERGGHFSSRKGWVTQGGTNVLSRNTTLNIQAFRRPREVHLFESNIPHSFLIFLIILAVKYGVRLHDEHPPGQRGLCWATLSATPSEFYSRKYYFLSRKRAVKNKE